MKNEQKILFLLIRDAIESFMRIHVIQLYNNCNVAIFNFEVSRGISTMYVPAIKKYTHWSQAFVW